MGMDQQSVGVLQQGVNLAGDVMNLFNSSADDGTQDYQNMAAEQANMMELDAKGDALDIQRKAKENASDFRGTQEQGRAKANTTWGGSNLAMSGSKQLVKEGNRIQDQQDEEDILFKGETAAQDTLNTGRNKANIFRINSGVSPTWSTLSLGSKIYK